MKARTQLTGTGRSAGGPAPWLARAWLAIASVPLFFLLALAVGEGLYSLLGYRPENADAPAWVVVVCAIPTLAVALLPCAAAVVFGSRASRAGDRHGRIPALIGVLIGTGWVLLTVVSELGNLLRR